MYLALLVALVTELDRLDTLRAIQDVLIADLVMIAKLQEAIEVRGRLVRQSVVEIRSVLRLLIGRVLILLETGSFHSVYFLHYR